MKFPWVQLLNVNINAKTRQILFQYLFAYYYFTLCVFFIPIFNYNPTESKLPQFSRTFLCILAGFSSAMVWMVLIFLLISSSLSFVFRPLGIVLRALSTTGIGIIFMFHSFFSSLARSKYLSLLFSLHFHFMVHCNSKFHELTNSFLVVNYDLV